MDSLMPPPPDEPTPLPGELPNDVIPLVRADAGPLSWREWVFSNVSLLNWRVFSNVSLLNWRGFLFVVFWGVFIQSNWRGCDSAQRLKRIEDQQREFNQRLFELRQSLPPLPREDR